MLDWREMKRSIKRWGKEKRFLRFVVGFILFCASWSLSQSLLVTIAVLVGYEVIVS